METFNARIHRFKIKIRDWFLRHAEGPHMKAWLAFFSFIEAIFFPLPPDLLLIPIVSANGKRWLYYATLTTVTSVVGGVVGFLIGHFLFDTLGKPIVVAYHLQDELARIGELFNENAFWAIFISGFSPVPYKLFTLGAGFFNIPFFTFVVASIISRAARFYLVAFLASIFGARLGQFIFTYFNALSIFIVILIVLLVLLL